jgi:flagellar motor switch protein FliG
MSAAGLRKTAILLIQLGRTQASEILSRLSENEVEAISAEISRLDQLTKVETEHVLGEFRDLLVAREHIAQGGLSYAQQLLEESLGVDRAAEIMGRLERAAIQTPFQFLHRADPSQLRTFIANEHPQVIALILAHMTPEKAALLMSGLESSVQAQVAHRIAVMDRTSPENIKAVEEMLEKKLSSVLQPAELSRSGGVDPLVDIINRSDRATERMIVEALEELDPALADEVRSRMFLFEDIVQLDNKSVQMVLREINTADLAMAMKGAADPVRDKIIENMSTQAGKDLTEEIDVLGSVRIKQVEESQQKIIRVIRTLEEQGKIIIRRGGDDELID